MWLFRISLEVTPCKDGSFSVILFGIFGSDPKHAGSLQSTYIFIILGNINPCKECHFMGNFLTKMSTILSVITFTCSSAPLGFSWKVIFHMIWSRLATKRTSALFICPQCPRKFFPWLPNQHRSNAVLVKPPLLLGYFSEWKLTHLACI